MHLIQNQKSLGVHKILVRKIWSPLKRAQNEEKLYKPVDFLKIDTFPGGGWTRFYGQNDFMDIWAFLREVRRSEKLESAVTVNFRRYPARTESGHKVQGSVNTRLAVGVPFIQKQFTIHDS